MKNFIRIAVLAASILAIFAGLAWAQDIRVFVNNNEVAFIDQKPFINADSRTMVPVRFISEKLGAKVDWLAPTRTVKVTTNEGETIQLQIGLKTATTGTGGVSLDTAPAIVNNRTMVPLRFVSECLGAKVEWDGLQQSVYIYSANYLEDAALIQSDLLLGTPPTGNSSKIELCVNIQYKYTTPVEPQMADLKEIIAKHLGGEGDPVYAYAETKTSTEALLKERTWIIKGKKVKVADEGNLCVIIWSE